MADSHSGSTIILRFASPSMASVLRSLLEAPLPPQVSRMMTFYREGQTPMSYLGAGGAALHATPPPAPAPQQLTPTLQAQQQGGVSPPAPAQVAHDPRLFTFYLPYPLPATSASTDPDPTTPTLETKLVPAVSTLYKLKSYPALLLNLPTVTEIVKGGVGGGYVKSCDVGQMLLVFPSRETLEAYKSENKPHPKYPSYAPSGLTPPMADVVRRRWAESRVHGFPPPFEEVRAVESKVANFIRTALNGEAGVTAVGSGAGGRRRISRRTGGQGTTVDSKGVVTQVVEETGNYEGWMDDWGRCPGGITVPEGKVGDLIGVWSEMQEEM